MGEAQTVADLVLSHSEEIKTIASITSYLLRWIERDF